MKTILALLLILIALPLAAEEETMASQKNDYQKLDEAIAKLTPEQFRVTQREGTEPPYQNAYWDSHAQGIYVDVVSGEPLFSSIDKFDSGTGWPSFTRPLIEQNVVEKRDNTMGMVRIEVRSARANSHLGHLFDDGPTSRGGLRYCINSASLRFIPKQELAREGYGEFLPLFQGQ